jgi:phosphoserine phosphatase RsbX
VETSSCNFAVVGVASKPLQGQIVSGDLHVVIPFNDGLLVAAIDGLGHGQDAAAASKVAAETMSTCASQSVISVVRQCHEHLHGTRGVVMSLASFGVKNNIMTWLSVGNVEGYVIRAADPRIHDRPCILMRGGVVGHSLPPLREETLPIYPGDTLVMATDGIKSGFSGALNPADSPQIIADNIIAHFARETDDAMVIVVRWLGNSA